MDQFVTIMGGGAMGTACAFVLSQHPDLAVRLWVRNAEYAKQISATRENVRLLPGVRLPDSIVVSSDTDVAFAKADVVVICIPTRGIRDAASHVGGSVPAAALLCSAVKGIENETLLRPSQMIQQVLGDRPVVALGGPCHAEEVARRKPASIVAACDDLSCAKRIQKLMSTAFLRIYTNSDLRGVEYSAALKNVIAIAAGICDGLEYGDNARSALITRGLAEMVRFGRALGIQPETFYGLAGVGDLVVTCGSRHSRNRAVGEALGRGQSLEQIKKSTASVAEGVRTAASIVDLARKKGLEMPIATEVYRVLFEGRSPREATEELMARPLREE
jgi:glycerol-3-phosphate dehydrogenase (NAD(P)+)